MAIPQTKYVNIVSAVGGTSALSTRDLIARIFTSNKLVPTNKVLEFTGGATSALKAVEGHFGILSNEYKFAAKYFGFVSKKATQPQKISFAHFSSEDEPAYLIGAVKSAKLTDFTALTNADVTFKLDGTNYALTALDFASATSFSDVAQTITGALITAGYDDDLVFEYETDSNRFVLKSIALGEGHVLDYATGSIATLLGMQAGNAGAILSDSASSQTALGSLTASAELSNNFFTFDFLDSISGSEEAVAEWVSSQNVRYMWCKAVSSEEAATLASLLKDYDGVCLTLDKYGEFANYLPMAIAASIDYSNPNAAVNFMYQQGSGITPNVISSEEQEAYDSIKVNYYGSTQQAGALVSFYQDGVLQGAISDMGVYTNEAWLKDAIFTNLLNLRLGLDSLPANTSGLGLVKMSIQEIIDKALYNGVFSVGKTLDSAQKAYVTQITGDHNAWMNIQSNGYYLSATIEKYVESGVEKYKVTYLLVYAKGDSINFIDGRDILI